MFLTVDFHIVHSIIIKFMILVQGWKQQDSVGGESIYLYLMHNRRYITNLKLAKNADKNNI